MSDKVYQTVTTLSNEKILDVLIDTIIFSQENTGHKIAKRLGVSPQSLDVHIQKRKRRDRNGQ